MLSQDLDTVVPHAEDNVSVFKRAINEGDTDAVEQLLDNGKYLLDIYDEMALLLAINQIAVYESSYLLRSQ